MLELDQFESVFKSASKLRYERGAVEVRSVLVVTDLAADATRLFAKDVRDFVSTARDAGDLTWEEACGGEFDDTGQMLRLVEDRRPDLICTYRNLHGGARGFPFSLGAYVDVLTQATTTPVLLLPAPAEGNRLTADCRRIRTVMVLTDALTGADRLVDYGARFSGRGGTLHLVHLEDDKTFRRYVSVISKLPSIDTDTATEDISRQLLKEPSDYVDSVRIELSRWAPDLTVSSTVEMGHRVIDVKRLVSERAADLMVLNTKDEEQAAMHGLAYPLAVELRDLPLLML